jgi:hypothetical protein
MLDYEFIKIRIEESPVLFNIERGETLRLLRIFGAKGLLDLAIKIVYIYSFKTVHRRIHNIKFLFGRLWLKYNFRRKRGFMT